MLPHSTLSWPLLKCNNLANRNLEKPPNYPPVSICCVDPPDLMPAVGDMVQGQA